MVSGAEQVAPTEAGKRVVPLGPHDRRMMPVDAERRHLTRSFVAIRATLFIGAHRSSLARQFPLSWAWF
eukprot:3153379-Alexandrium_andersonii.AAC.1